MNDDLLQALERRWRASGAVEDEAARLVAGVREGELGGRDLIPTLSEVALRFRDRADLPLDPGVMDTVVALWSRGLWTSFSCAGHVHERWEAGWSFSGPQVVVEAPCLLDDPFAAVARGPTPEEQLALQRWQAANLEAQARLVALVEAFYQDREPSTGARLIVFPAHHEWGVSTLACLGADATRVAPQAEQRPRLSAYQAEFAAFTAHLLSATRGDLAPPAPNLIVLRAQDLDAARRFYEALGLAVELERHGAGPAHLAAVQGGVVVEVYPRRGPADSTAATRVGFRVSDLAATLERVTAAGGVLVQGPRPSPWGRRAVLRDPEGHTVELSEVVPS